jgi:hypothetical protein
LRSVGNISILCVVNSESVMLEVPEEISRAQSVGTRWIITTSLLWGSWCCGCLLPDVDVDLTGISRWLSCKRGHNGELLLSPDSSGSIGVFRLLSLLVCYSILWWYVYRDDQDLAIWVSKSSPRQFGEVVVWATWNARRSEDDSWFILQW